MSVADYVQAFRDLLGDLLLGIEAVLADGTIVSDMRKLRKNNTGSFVARHIPKSSDTSAILWCAPPPLRRRVSMNSSGQA
jgi:hypothetical protein